MSRGLLALALGLATAFASLSVRAALDYQLQPQLIAEDTYVVLGRHEDFDFDNGGNIVNTAFVVTDAGVVVIDTGSSRLYGRQLRQAIARVTSLPILRVYNTHHHPDHYFGNQAFSDVPIHALAASRQAMQVEGPGFADNLYRMAGLWMRGTEPLAAGEDAQAGEFELGGHSFRLFDLAGHTGRDLVILDQTTGTLFAGDLVFSQRTLTTPHAEIGAWLRSLEFLGGLQFQRLVPGHGPVQTDTAAITATAEHLRWLRSTIRAAVEAGLSMSEAMQLPIPPEYAGIALARREFVRSVVHLYPLYEASLMPRIDQPAH